MGQPWNQGAEMLLGVQGNPLHFKPQSRQLLRFLWCLLVQGMFYMEGLIDVAQLETNMSNLLTKCLWT